MARKPKEILDDMEMVIFEFENNYLSGLKKILELREKINEGKGRTRKYGIKDVFPERESPETIR